MPESIHIDRLLTNLAERYRVNDAVGDFIAPPFKVKRTSDKYAQYTKGNTFRLFDNKVSGREVAKEITGEVVDQSYSTEEFSLGRFISQRKVDNADKPINLFFDATRQLKDAQLLAREKRVFDIAGNAALITNNATPAAKWDVVTSGTPIADIKAGMVSVWTNSTRPANSIVVPMDVAIEMTSTDEYRDYFKYTDKKVNEQFNIVKGLMNLSLQPMMAGTFGVNTNEGGASDPATETIWSDTVLIFNRQATPTLETRTFMYSPFRKKDEMRRLEGTVQKQQRGILFDIYEDIDELLVDSDAAYLVTDTLTD